LDIIRSLGKIWERSNLDSMPM